MDIKKYFNRIGFPQDIEISPGYPLKLAEGLVQEQFGETYVKSSVLM